MRLKICENLRTASLDPKLLVLIPKRSVFFLDAAGASRHGSSWRWLGYFGALSHQTRP